MRVILNLAGHIPSKKNLYRFGKHGIYRVKAVEDQIRSLETQARIQWQRAGMTSTVEHPRLSFRLRIKNFAQDRDNCITTIFDVLQAAGVLSSDNVAHCNGGYVVHPAVRGEPGCEIRLTFPLDPAKQLALR